jgi:DNA-directed RNA polymerase subunit L
MEITERLKEIILKETDIDVSKNSRKHNIIEARALYFYLVKHFKPKMTLQEIAESVNKNHATVIHSLNNYTMYEKFNRDLRSLRNIIVNEIDEQNVLNTEDNEELRLELKKKNLKVSELEIQLEETNLRINKLEKAAYEYKIIEQLNNLLNQTKDTEHHNVMILRLEAIYDMNMKVIEHNKNN